MITRNIQVTQCDSLLYAWRIVLINKKENSGDPPSIQPVIDDRMKYIYFIYIKYIYPIELQREKESFPKVFH